MTVTWGDRHKCTFQRFTDTGSELTNTWGPKMPPWFTRQNRGLWRSADQYLVQISLTMGPAGPQTHPVPERVIGVDLRCDCEIYTLAPG